jgi:flagellar hook-length control protein FliK
VRVQLGHDHQTSISFSSPHAQVRDALETAVPRLREMFGESGLTLGNVDVSHHSMSGQGQAGQHDNHNTSTPARLTNSPAESLEVSAMQRAPITTGTGMLDLYA